MPEDSKVIVNAPPVSGAEDPRIKALEARINALETEKRVDRIHAKLPNADTKGKSLEFLDGAVWGVEEYVKSHAKGPVSPLPAPKANSAVAETVPKSDAALKGKKVGDFTPIDGDEALASEGSEI
jgi:hypothetical protein